MQGTVTDSTPDSEATFAPVNPGEPTTQTPAEEGVSETPAPTEGAQATATEGASEPSAEM